MSEKTKPPIGVYSKENIIKGFKAAFPHTLPVMAGYVVLGFGLGLLMQSKGYGIFWVLASSLFVFAGSMQYVCVDLLTGGAGLITTAVMTLMVNARHLFYGFSMLVRYRDIGRIKPLLIFQLTDETYSLVSHLDTPEGVEKDCFYWGISTLNQSYWVLGSAAGCIFGQMIPVNTNGVDFSMTALFLVIVLDNLLKKSTRLTSLIGIACSIACLLVFGPNNFLIPSMILITAVLIFARPALAGKEAKA